MRKEKFIYNTSTLRYERVEVTLKERILKIIGFACAILVSGFLFTLLVWKLFPSPQEEARLQEIEILKDKLREKSEDVAQLSKVLDNIHERDVAIHRMVLEMDPIDDAVWDGGIGGSDRYANERSLQNSGDVMADLEARVDKLKRQMVMQSKSLDDIENRAKQKEDILASIPSIKPVRGDKLKRRVKLLSGFGRRLHPVHKVWKMHNGIDFTAPSGTPIQATGNGKVVRVEKKRSGYGHNVIIDHGYGYETLYAHMSKILVQKGEVVTKGQKIGLVGSTGTSTAPHCHYEVKYRGKAVNPIDFVMDGLNPDEYAELVKLSETANQSFD